VSKKKNCWGKGLLRKGKGTARGGRAKSPGLTCVGKSKKSHRTGRDGPYKGWRSEKENKRGGRHNLTSCVEKNTFLKPAGGKRATNYLGGETLGGWEIAVFRMGGVGLGTDLARKNWIKEKIECGTSHP